MAHIMAHIATGSAGNVVEIPADLPDDKINEFLQEQDANFRQTVRAINTSPKEVLTMDTACNAMAHMAQCIDKLRMLEENNTPLDTAPKVKVPKLAGQTATIAFASMCDEDPFLTLACLFRKWDGVLLRDAVVNAFTRRAEKQEAGVLLPLVPSTTSVRQDDIDALLQESVQVARMKAPLMVASVLQSGVSDKENILLTNPDNFWLIFLCGDYRDAENKLSALLVKAANRLDRALVPPPPLAPPSDADASSSSDSSPAPTPTPAPVVDQPKIEQVVAAEAAAADAAEEQAPPTPSSSDALGSSGSSSPSEETQPTEETVVEIGSDGDGEEKVVETEVVNDGEEEGEAEEEKEEIAAAAEAAAADSAEEAAPTPTPASTPEPSESSD